MKGFVKRFREMYGTKDESKKPKEKKYKSSDINIVKNTSDGNIYICLLESLGKVGEYVVKIGANNIEDESRITEYKLQMLPAGRVTFGGYVNEEDKTSKSLYSFSDVWYKIYGKLLNPDRTFTKGELLDLQQEIIQKLKQAKFDTIYSIRYKDSAKVKEFEGTKYFGRCREDEQAEPVFEAIDDSSIFQTVGDKRYKDLVITIYKDLFITVGPKKIKTKIKVIDGIINDSEESPFDVQKIETKGVSRVFNKSEFTLDACRQIIRDYKREKEEGRG